MRIFVALLVGLALGLGGGWALFERPWKSDTTTKGATAVNAAFVADALLRQQRSEGAEFDSASCSERQASAGREYVCTTNGGRLRESLESEAYDYVATVQGHRISFRRRAIR
jgi:hypothetical protein